MNQFRYRRVLLAALAISFVALGGVATPGFADPSEAGLEHRNERAEASESRGKPAAASAEAAGTEDAPHDNGGAADNDQTFTGGRSEEESPAGQGCDGTHHSDTGNGANTDGADNSYHNTCDGTASQNGGGNGEAKGLPCAGCVGNADDKNPPGQHKDGSDANSGYECDYKGNPNGGNMGVGASNPAHTGCEPASVTETCPNGKVPDANGNCDTNPTCPDGSAMPANGKCGGDTCPDGSAMPANGKCETPPPGDTAVAASTGAAVQGTVLGRPAEVLGVQISRPAVAPATLSRTGTDAATLVQVGLGLAVLGLGLVIGTRRRPAIAVSD